MTAAIEQLLLEGSSVTMTVTAIIKRFMGKYYRLGKGS